MTLKQSLVCQKKIIRNNYKQLAGGCLRIAMEPSRHACYHTVLGDADVASCGTMVLPWKWYVGSAANGEQIDVL